MRGQFASPVGSFMQSPRLKGISDEFLMSGRYVLEENSFIVPKKKVVEHGSPESFNPQSSRIRARDTSTWNQSVFDDVSTFSKVRGVNTSVQVHIEVAQRVSHQHITNFDPVLKFEVVNMEFEALKWRKMQADVHDSFGYEAGLTKAEEMLSNAREIDIP